MSRTRLVTIKALLLRETNLAMQVQQNRRGDEAVWIPKSQCQQTSKHPLRPNGTRDMEARIPEWLAEAKDLRAEA